MGGRWNLIVNDIMIHDIYSNAIILLLHFNVFENALNDGMQLVCIEQEAAHVGAHSCSKRQRPTTDT